MTTLTPEERARGPLHLLRHIDEQDAEIERLKEENSALENSLVEQDFENDRLKKIITELCDAMEGWPIRSPTIIQRAREATR